MAGDPESTSDLQKPLLGTQLTADAAANVASAVDSLSGRGQRVPHLDIRQLAFDGAMTNVLGGAGRAASPVCHFVPSHCHTNAHCSWFARPQWVDPLACTRARSRAGL